MHKARKKPVKISVKLRRTLWPIWSDYRVSSINMDRIEENKENDKG